MKLLLIPKKIQVVGTLLKKFDGRLMKLQN